MRQVLKTDTILYEFDPSALMERVDNDNDLLKEILKMFAAGCEEHFNKMRTAVSMNDAASLSGEAHSFKGEILTIEYPPACKNILQIEMIAKSGSTIGVDVILEDLQISLQPIFSFIEKNIK